MTNLDVHARKGDPASSSRALNSIARNGTIKHLVIQAIVRHATPVSDDMILNYVELETCKRQQRNVIARTRGLLENAGYCLRVAADLTIPGTVLTFIPTQLALDYMQRNQ
jgi:hypothetical protein